MQLEVTGLVFTTVSDFHAVRYTPTLLMLARRVGTPYCMRPYATELIVPLPKIVKRHG